MQERVSIWKGCEPVIIYTMGGVGSNSIYLTLKKYIGSKVLFVHRMLPENIKLYNQIFIKAGVRPDRSALSSYIFEKLIKPSKKCIIITLIREPISRNSSDFFQDFHVYNRKKYSKDIPLKEIKSNFINNYPHLEPVDWFSNEFMKTLSLNFETFPFDKEAKYGLFHSGNRTILAMRIDLSQSKKEELIKSVLDLREFKLHNFNLSSNKPYYQTYEKFKEEILLPGTLIDEILNNSTFQHFYLKDEIDSFINYWKR